MSGSCEKPYAISYALYQTISLFSFRILTKTYLYPTGITYLGVSTICVNISRFVSEFNCFWITSFHISQSFLCRHSFIICNSISSLFLVMSKATLNPNTSFIIILF